MQRHTCEYRKVSHDGRIICSKILLGDNQVCPSLCRGCPAKACNCPHLRFSLQNSSLSPIIVRWGNGNAEIWDDLPPALSFLHSACETRTIPISSPSDCIACSVRRRHLTQEETHVAPQEAIDISLRSSSGHVHDGVIPFAKARAYRESG
jgi:hypothetical protein